MINSSYYTSPTTSFGFRSSVPSSNILFHSTPTPTITTGSIAESTCPISQSRIVQELTSLHTLLLQYIQCSGSGGGITSSCTSPNKQSAGTFGGNSVCYTSPSKYSSQVCDLNFAQCGSRFTSSSYSSEGIGNPLMSINTSPVRGSASSQSYSTNFSSFNSNISGGGQQYYSNSSISMVSEYEERISRLEQLVKQTLSLIYRGDYKPANTKASVQVVEHNAIKQSMSTKIKETYQLDMEPLKQIVASVVHYEPKRCNMGYDIIFQMKTELAFLSQLCK